MKNEFKILTIFGTRPEAIKMAPVIKVIEKEEGVSSVVCITAQQREMLDQVLKVFEIKPDFDLNVMSANQTLNSITAKVIENLKSVFDQVKPDLVLIHGDTSTSFVAALAAFYEKIPVGHVEAGLRTGNKYSPWPEEMNRQLTGRLATFHFAPTETARKNLLDEGINDKDIHVTGNTVIDALLQAKEIIALSDVNTKLNKRFDYLSSDRDLLLVTGHRRENFGAGFQNICKALSLISERHDVDIVYPVHLNPNVKEPVEMLLGAKGNIHLIEPLDYLSFVYLMNRAKIILTDSGGIQEEAPSLGVPVLVMRESTERPEAIEAGTVKLVGTDVEVILAECEKLLNDENYFKDMTRKHNPYGDGEASYRIMRIISEWQSSLILNGCDK